MPTPPYELAIFGSTPLAGLLAGRLAAEHRKRVVLIAETPSPFRLPTGFDLSVAPITRPESWALLKDGAAETSRLLRQLGARQAVRHVDPLFMAETMAGNVALSHIRMMAMGFGFAAERVPHAAGQIGVRIRDAVLLDRPALAPLLSTWLGRIGVERLEARHANAVFSREGSVKIDHLGKIFEATQAVLADDEAILTWLDTALAERALTERQATITLTAPTRRLAAPLVVHLDRGVTLLDAHGREVLAFGVGQCSEAAGPYGGGVVDQGPPRRLAQRQLRVIMPKDGAPFIGQVSGGKAIILAGFGPGAAFFAPALARHLVGASSAAEGAYFSARQAQRGTDDTIADYAPPLEALA